MMLQLMLKSRRLLQLTKLGLRGFRRMFAYYRKSKRASSKKTGQIDNPCESALALFQRSEAQSHGFPRHRLITAAEVQSGQDRLTSTQDDKDQREQRKS